MSCSSSNWHWQKYKCLILLHDVRLGDLRTGMPIGTVVTSTIYSSDDVECSIQTWLSTVVERAGNIYFILHMITSSLDYR